ncbi:hypothetical protein BpHYR1_026985 [Brachionus plicatilis]|uniref:Uncharacterized protein n=1 Tax=Brachionus plicatilis TaxID=10195 RepID=A0A3M7SP70_BRAPC|nr:hypothetical protein BpHYR1_026985 [Brachionus plicatilis]
MAKHSIFIVEKSCVFKQIKSIYFNVCFEKKIRKIRKFFFMLSYQIIYSVSVIVLNKCKVSVMDKEIFDDLNVSRNSIKKSPLRLSKSLNIYTPKYIQISLEIGDTSKFTEFVSQNVFSYNQFKTPNLFFVNDYKSDEEIEEELEETYIEMNQSEKKKQKRFALSWVGKSVGKIGKRNQTYHVHLNNSRTSGNKKNISSSDRNNTADSVASILRHQSSKSSFKKLIKTDWSENAKQGIHIWSDFSNQANELCYLSEQDTIEFHNLNKNLLCSPQSENLNQFNDKYLNMFKILNKKKCQICKIIVHEACIESVQNSYFVSFLIIVFTDFAGRQEILYNIFRTKNDINKTIKEYFCMKIHNQNDRITINSKIIDNIDDSL